ncbi:ferric siderophore receptor [Oxalicibacterium flavum]|uniref:Ferric siderophore receptor n=1 Tax=Oxalicibacterium flavum TaxID=179467 RepID=A0A8J2UQG9_9BURK|nr:TonB-dependent siderophore receptor [Oxalicibacterium flavum]GGC12778.1 ferric siderophore receptor [Oxalicibacterium flavum]
MSRIHAVSCTTSRVRLPQRTLLAAAILLMAGGVQFSPSAHAQTPQTAAASISFRIAAGPLGTALEQFARATGVNVSYDAQLVNGVFTPGLDGTYGVAASLRLLLTGSGIEAIEQPGGGFQLRKAATAAVNAVTLPTVSVTTQAETATGPLVGYVARRATAGSKTDTPIVETPQSVSVVTNDELRNRQAETLAQALNYTPGFTSQPTSFNRTADRFRIRGIDVESANSGSMRDGLRLQSNSYDGIQEPYGLERVEVLRGAASVLYGQLSPGGVVNAVSKRPVSEPIREIGLQLGSHDRRQLMADFSGAVPGSETLDYRLTMLGRDSNTAGKYIPDDKLYIAPALTWRPSAATSLTLLSFYQKTDTRFSAPLPYQLVEGVGNGPHTIGRDDFIGEPNYDKMKGEMFTIGYELDHALNANTRINHRLRFFESKVTWNYLQAQTSAAAIAAAASTGILRRQYSDRQEHAKGIASDTRVEWDGFLLGAEHKLLVGIDAYRMDYDSQNFRANASSLNIDTYNYGQPVVVNRDPSLNRGSRLQTNQTGLYAQDQINLGERWSMVFGLRHDWAEQDQTAHRDGRRALQKDEATTWRAGVVYKMANGFAPYLSYSESFFPVSVSEVSGQTFQPTRGKQYEAGLRYQPEDSRMLLSAAIYELTQDNVLKFDAGQNAYRQTGEVRSRGFEIEAKAEVSPELSIIASYAYTDARVTRSTIASEIGQRSEDTPYHQAAVWADYNFGAWRVPQLRLATGLRYKGTTHASGISTPMPAYTLIDAMLGYQIDAHWDFSFNVSNLADKKFTYCEFAICRYGDERQVSANLLYRW